MLPERRVHRLAVLRIDGKVRAAGVGGAHQGLLPGLPRVLRDVHAALVAVVEEWPERAGEDLRGIGGIDRHPRDALGLLEAELLPAVASVGGPIDAVAHRDAVAHPRLAGAHPDRLRVLRVDPDVADRRVVLVEHGLEPDSAVVRFPHAPGGGAHVDGQPASRDRVDGGDTPTHDRGADAPGFEAAEGVGVDLDVLRGRKTGEGEHGQRPGVP